MPECVELLPPDWFPCVSCSRTSLLVAVLGGSSVQPHWWETVNTNVKPVNTGCHHIPLCNILIVCRQTALHAVCLGPVSLQLLCVHTACPCVRTNAKLASDALRLNAVLCQLSGSAWLAAPSAVCVGCVFSVSDGSSAGPVWHQRLPTRPLAFLTALRSVRGMSASPASV